jgi:hypothetical protein
LGGDIVPIESLEGHCQLSGSLMGVCGLFPYFFLLGEKKKGLTFKENRIKTSHYSFPTKDKFVLLFFCFVFFSSENNLYYVIVRFW